MKHLLGYDKPSALGPQRSDAIQGSGKKGAVRNYHRLVFDSAQPPLIWGEHEPARNSGRSP